VEGEKKEQKKKSCQPLPCGRCAVRWCGRGTDERDEAVGDGHEATSSALALGSPSVPVRE
jgi:hypothetical protein